jgi:hypothetical protein
MAELADFAPGDGHRHDCRAVRRSLACSCALQLYEVATDLSLELALRDEEVDR